MQAHEVRVHPMDLVNYMYGNELEKGNEEALAVDWTRHA